MRTQEEIYKIPLMEHEPGSIGYLEKIFIAQILLMSNAEFIIETGSFKGQTTKFLSQFMLQNNLNGQILSFDMPVVIEEIMKNDSYFSTVPNVKFIKGTLPDTLQQCLSDAGRPLDFAIIDSEHSFKQVIAELDSVHPHLREGAYVFCHDYLEGNKTYEGVVQAVNEFSLAFNYSMLPLTGRHIWGAAILRKPVSK